MRIGLVIESFDPQRGGAEQWTWQFAQRLVSRGHEVHVISRHFPVGPGRMPVQFHRIEVPPPRVAFAEAAERLLTSLRLDVVHDMGAGWYCDIFEPHFGCFDAQWERKLALLPRFARPVKRRLAQWLPRYVDLRRFTECQLNRRKPLVLAVSQMVAEDFHRCHAVPRERLRVVYNGVDTARFSPEQRKTDRERTRQALNVRPEEALFLFVGHNFHLKGLGTLLPALGQMARGGLPVRLAVLGGKRIRRYAALAQRHGAGEATAFLGSVPAPESYYAAADAFVLPTFHDSCSLSLLEAAASGLPLITTRHNGASELMVPGREGFVLPDPRDAEALRRHMTELLDPSLRQRMGEAARAMAERHTLDHQCDQLLSLYGELSKRRLAA